METVKPDYYDKFICAADRCPYTCCQQWDIYVDGETRRKWKRLEVPEELKGGMQSLTECIEGDRIRFGADRRCRLMTESGLCRIVLKHGEENIPHTCHIFPRERHELPGRIEYALSPECPEVLRLLWGQDVFTIVSKETKEIKQACKSDRIGNCTQETDRLACAIRLRDSLLAILQDAAYAAVDTAVLLTVCLAILQDAYRKEADQDRTEQDISDAYIAEIIDAILSAKESRDTDPQAAASSRAERNELLMDSLYEYQDQGRYPDFINPVMELAGKYDETGRRDEAGEYEPFLRRLFAEEIYSSLLPSADAADCDIIYFMIIKLEWLIMACSNIRHCLMLRQQSGRPGTIDSMTETVVIIMRVMGFADDDIMEYMEEEFEDAVWPMAYAVLLI